VLSNYQSLLALAARLLMALLFLPEGIGKIDGFAGIVTYISAAGLPLPELGAVIAIVLEAGGSLALLAGYQTRWVALVLALFALATGFFFHKFWAVPADQVMDQHIMFFKNLAIAGGLFMLTAFGAGAWSVDTRRND
jgi:putative oxidoreductase